MSTELRVQVRPPWPFRLTRRSGMDGLSPVRGGVLHRLLHLGPAAVHVRVAQLASGEVMIGAAPLGGGGAAQRGGAPGESPATLETAVARVRRALGVDLDLREFHELFRGDPLIGGAVRADPTLRPPGRPDAFQALAWAVTEQLIEYERAAAIQRRIVAALGPRDALSGLRDSPAAAVLAGVAPARLQSFDLAGGRAIALVKAAREVASGRVELESSDRATQEAGWRRLRAIPGIGAWTVEMLALTGQGRIDQLPAGDLAFIKLVGRILSGGDPYARADERQVREYFARFGPWQGLAAAYALRAAGPRKAALAAA